jgi:hypothetical protein
MVLSEARGLWLFLVSGRRNHRDRSTANHGRSALVRLHVEVRAIVLRTLVIGIVAPIPPREHLSSRQDSLHKGSLFA